MQNDKKGALQILPPLALHPVRAKIKSAPTITHIYIDFHIFQKFSPFNYALTYIRRLILCVFSLTQLTV